MIQHYYWAMNSPILNVKNTYTGDPWHTWSWAFMWTLTNQTLEWQVKRKNGFKKEGFETVMHVLGCIPLWRKKLIQLQTFTGFTKIITSRYSQILHPGSRHPLRLIFEPSYHLLQHVRCHLEVIVHYHPVKVVSILGLNLATFIHQVV